MNICQTQFIEWKKDDVMCIETVNLVGNTVG